MRYALSLEMLEHNAALADERAIGLLRSEFALAQNAGSFHKVTSGDIELGAVSRSTPQEGVTRYLVELLVDERDVGFDDQRALAVLCRAFTDALNASYFLRICNDGLTMRLISREPIAESEPLSFAA